MTSVGARYLERIGVAAPTATDLESLAGLLTAHMRTIPFENLTSFTGTPVTLEPGAVLDKLLDQRRGGYCFEHALLSRLALIDVGFHVEPVLARVYRNGVPDVTPMRSHNATLVHLDGQDFLYDPGFGGGSPTSPLLISAAAGEQKTSGSPYRFVAPDDSGIPRECAPDVHLMLQQLTDEGWANQYGITTGTVVPADVAAFNWHVSTAPTSIFTTTLMGSLVRPEGRVTLADGVLRRRTSRGPVERLLMSEAELDTALRSDLGLTELDPAMVSAAWAGLSARRLSSL